MDRLEMIEKLRALADISYEEAKEILDQSDNDLLAAVVLLEKQGRLRQQQTNTSREEETVTMTLESTADTAGSAQGTAGASTAQRESSATGAAGAADAASAGSSGKKEREKGAFSKALHRFGNFLSRTAFHVRRNDRELLMIPSWTFALLLFFFWETIVPVMVIALFFNVRYSFDGSEDVSAANEVLDKAGSFADGLEHSFAANSDQ